MCSNDAAKGWPEVRITMAIVFVSLTETIVSKAGLSPLDDMIIAKKILNIVGTGNFKEPNVTNKVVLNIEVKLTCESYLQNN